MTSDLKQLCIDLEHFETPEWAARAILKKEILTSHVLDPCCGTGILAETALREGYHVTASDIQEWGYKAQSYTDDFLTTEAYYTKYPFTVFMNPPFSMAERFVEKSFEMGARKIVCFQRLAWWESKKRREFWAKNPPNRIYICGDRADCWRHDIPVNDKGHRIDPETGKIMNGTPTAHAWFVWERDQPAGTLMGHIYKP